MLEILRRARIEMDEVFRGVLLKCIPVGSVVPRNEGVPLMASKRPDHRLRRTIEGITSNFPRTIILPFQDPAPVRSILTCLDLLRVRLGEPHGRSTTRTKTSSPVVGD